MESPDVVYLLPECDRRRLRPCFLRLPVPAVTSRKFRRLSVPDDCIGGCTIAAVDAGSPVSPPARARTRTIPPRFSVLPLCPTVGRSVRTSGSSISCMMAASRLPATRRRAVHPVTLTA